MLKQIIMAGYIRESSLFLADSTTIESAAKAVREYGEKKGYIYPLHLEFKEAISAKETAYFQRPRPGDMLKAAERGEFQVLVITEVRALSRRGAGEVLIINSELQKYGISLETLSESFSNDDAGELMLGSKAHFAEVERQVIHARMERGKVDRIMIGHAPNGHPKPAYGYRFLDTDRETKAKYVFNYTIVHVDATGKEWSEYDVCLFIFSRALQRVSLSGICRQLTEIGIPTPMTGYRKLTPNGVPPLFAGYSKIPFTQVRYGAIKNALRRQSMLSVPRVSGFCYQRILPPHLSRKKSLS